MKEHDPRDIDRLYIIVDTPFYQWLRDHDEPIFTIALRRYLEIGLGKPSTPLTGEQMNCYCCIHMHFYWVKHNERTRLDAD